MATVFENIQEENVNFETYSLIWLDSSVNDSNENIQAQTDLRSSINHLITFEDEQLCLDHIKSLQEDDRIVLIVSGVFGQTIVSRIIGFRQITSIYVYCFNREFHRQWTKNYIKIKGVFNQLNQLIEQIQTDQKYRQHSKIDESFSYNIFHLESDEGETTRDLNGEFLHSQLLIDCLIRIKSNCNDEKELIALCKQQYQDNVHELIVVKDFQETYSLTTSIWWYTRESFLYRLLNKALRVQNIHLLYLFRFIICDIQQQLEENKCTTPILVYRAQLMSNKEIQILAKSNEQIISMNAFLSTSLDAQYARSFLLTADLTNDTARVFFKIDADPQLENIKAFSDITSLSYYPNEKEVIFMIGSMFKLKTIVQDNDGIWIIEMTLCSFNNHHLQPLFKHMKKQLSVGETTLLKLGQILNDMGKFDDAQKCFLRSLKQLPEDRQNAGLCYFELGRLADNQRNYELSLEWYNKSLEIKEQTLQSNDPSIASTYGNMANVYRSLGNRGRALELYQKALIIYKEVFGESHPFVATCWNNMGNIHQEEEKYFQALKCYKKSFDIREESCPENHAHLGSSHGNLGIIHKILGDNEQALEHLFQSLEIYKKSRTLKDSRIASTWENIAAVYEEMDDFENALLYYEKAATFYRQTSPTDLKILQIEKSIQRVSTKLESFY